MKNNRWKKALSVALVCCMLAGTGQGFTVHAQDEAAQELYRRIRQTIQWPMRSM